MNVKLRNSLISVFVVAWTLLFHYESLRNSYLNPLCHRELPKCKFLFPPAGWIMFYNVGESESHTEVYGIIDGKYTLIDPHRIFENRWLGYDNIRRNVLLGALYPAYARPFCRYLSRKFPEYPHFAVTLVHYPNYGKNPEERRVGLQYAC